MIKTRLFLSVLVTALVACTLNPVTGKRHVQFYGTDWEQSVGAQMYTPLKQSDGGDFVLDPELTEYVQGVGQKLASRARRNDELQFEFSILNSSVPNAWALPGGKIVVNRGLLTELGSEAQLAAVLGHEIVHADAAHGARAQSKGTLTQIGAVAGMLVIGSAVESPMARELGMMVPLVGAQLVTQKYGRDAEREADYYGMRYMAEAGYDTRGAVELQETFLRLSEGRNQNWLSGLFASHPASRERVENNRETAEILAREGFTGGEINREEWQRRLAYLHRVQPAYEHYDAAVEAASEKQWDRAQERLDKAMAIEPRESQFHSLQGDIHAARDRSESALASYDRAVQLNDGFFYGWLGKGLQLYESGNTQKARSSLERSIALLPTAQAHYALGRLELDAGRKVTALEHFRAASESASPAGRNSEREILRLELPERAAAHIGAQLATNQAGDVWLQVTNQTRTPLANIEYRYAWIDDQGQTREGSGRFTGVLEGGKVAQQPLGINIGSSTADLGRRVRVEVTGATVADSQPAARPRR